MKRYTTRKFSILALLFLTISVPLAVYSVVNLTSLDTRNRAADLTSDIETCQIRFPYINPSTIEINKTVQANVSAYTPGEAITMVSIMNRSGESVFKKEYTDGTDKISETFTLTPKDLGDFTILGTLQSDKGTRPCVVESGRSVNVVNTNTAPEFKTIPTSATPSNAIKVNDNYQYQFEATDGENDNINFAFSFTPNAKWLKPTVIENGSNGKLSIKFSGVPDKPGSYLANIFIHDGYNSNLRAQTWVINVDQDKNDTPKVSIIRPSTETKINKGEKVTVSWEAADLNLITKFELFIATNPGNENSWIALDRNLGPRVGNYIFDSKDIKEGTYQFVVRATDNFNPPASGVGFSSKVIIGQTDDKGPDDGVVLQEAQVVNISPSNESTIKNKLAIISATLIPSKDATIKKDSIKIILDDQDITSQSLISQGGENTYNIQYTPPSEYTEGLHKVDVSFEDSKENKAQKVWTFTVSNEESDNSDSYNIFGFEIPKRIALIVGAGLAILLLALIVPWLLYLAWKGSKDEDEYEIAYTTITPQSPTPVYTVNQEDEVVSSKKEEVVSTETEIPVHTESTKINAPVFTFNKPFQQSSNEEVEIKEPIQEENVSEISTVQADTEVNNFNTPVVPNVEFQTIEPTPVVVPPIVQTEPMTAPTVINEPVVLDSTQTTSQPVVTSNSQSEEDVTSDILANTNKELEDLAAKLREREEMINEFIPQNDSDSAPSSSSAENTSTQTPNQS